MRFDDALRKTSTGSGPVCTVKQWREGLSKSNREQFDAALKSNATSAAIHRAMKVMGYTHGDGTLMRHRRRECSCDVQ